MVVAVVESLHQQQVCGMRQDRSGPSGRQGDVELADVGQDDAPANRLIAQLVVELVERPDDVRAGLGRWRSAFQVAQIARVR